MCDLSQRLIAAVGDAGARATSGRLRRWLAVAASSARPWALLLLACAWPMVASAPARGRTLGDIFYVRQGSTEQLAAAYFPHWVHRVKYKCYVCHDELFPMRRGANPTMAMMAKGQSCGACHNGKVAFGADACHRCHAQR